MYTLDDFDYHLPTDLIAQFPTKLRTGSRLMQITRQQQTTQNHHFCDLIDLLQPGDTLFVNDSAVIPARLFTHKATGARVELLVERCLTSHSALVHIKANKPIKIDTPLYIDSVLICRVMAKQDTLYHIKSTRPIDDLMNEHGLIPIPPYLKRAQVPSDQIRYQTVYAQPPGSIAAPTAGLHFDDEVLNQLKEKGIELAYVTLHVGAGTFQPVRAETLKEHKMHTEYFEITQDLCNAISQTKEAGGRVIAVGTTSLRSLESAAQNGPLKPQAMDTNIFIYPGYNFKLCDGLITNFHLPQSTLLMLVAAFIGHAETMALYAEAISEQYRFFSYGDATLLL